MKLNIKKYKPTSPGIRHLTAIYCKYNYKPCKNLLKHKINSSGRNNIGRITCWHKGGGHKQKYRIIDWKRKKDYIPATVKQIEYDPNRSSDIALLIYRDGEKKYILSPNNLKINDVIESGENIPISVGNCLPLKYIPIGININCLEILPNSGAKLIKSAGTSAQILSKQDLYAIVRLQSGKTKKISLLCRAVIGQIGKLEHNLIKIGKAGRNRWKNIRPTVRGVAMNPIDHPMGGGEGKTSGGRHPCSPWGVINGTKTSKNKKKYK